MKILIATLILFSTQVTLAKKATKSNKKCAQCVVDYRECRTKAKSLEFPVSETTKCELTYTECSEENKCK